jgi:S-adenosylmethionine:tRNA ribosyltransferase-isomerase
MMVLHRECGEERTSSRPEFEHRHVADLPEYLHAGDLLVLNDTRVFPARVFGRREDTGGSVELLLLEEDEHGNWDALYRASRKARVGTRLVLGTGALRGELVAVGERGRVSVRLQGNRSVRELLETEGTMPVPPYIKRPRAGAPAAGPNVGDDLEALDRERYQTVYARRPGAVAAPTAGLHFSEKLLAELDRRGVRKTAITLHVGPGTFRPVKAERVADHAMESERFEVGPDAAAALNLAGREGRRVLAVGTTCVRTIETVLAEHGKMVPCEGRSSLFVHPPFEFRGVDALLTNFHLPRSTLLMLVCAFAGRERTLRAYRAAVEEGYRFYSYGDCMLIV